MKNSTVSLKNKIKSLLATTVATTVACGTLVVYNTYDDTTENLQAEQAASRYVDNTTPRVVEVSADDIKPVAFTIDWQNIDWQNILNILAVVGGSALVATLVAVLSDEDIMQGMGSSSNSSKNNSSNNNSPNNPSDNTGNGNSNGTTVTVNPAPIADGNSTTKPQPPKNESPDVITDINRDNIEEHPPAFFDETEKIIKKPTITNKTLDGVTIPQDNTGYNYKHVRFKGGKQDDPFWFIPNAPAGLSEYQYSRIAFNITNMWREYNGLNHLIWDDGYYSQAVRWNNVMLNDSYRTGKLNLWHSDDPVYENVAVRSSSENTSGNPQSPLMDGGGIWNQWRWSVGHNKNMLAPDAKYGAIALTRSNGVAGSFYNPVWWGTAQFYSVPQH